MKKLSLLILPVLFLVFGFSKQEKQVYICVSETASKYHYKKDCGGLKKCTHTIKKVSLSSAKDDYKRKLCGWED